VLMEESIKIIFADDKDLWRKSLIQDLLPFGILCIGEARNGEELLELLKSTQPDIILLDLRMPVMDGNHAMQFMHERYPGAKIIILSMHYEEELIDDYMARGAKGYIPKDMITIDLLVDAIRAVKNSGTFIYKPSMERQKYTPRQIEMIPLICDGMTNKEIAQEIGITEWGVEKQRQKIYAKTGAKKAVDFYKYAFRQGLDFLNRSIPKKKK
jgi:two-component system response regulator DegU